MTEERLTSDESAAERNKAADEAANVHYLSPGDFEIFEQGGVIRLTLPNEISYIQVYAFRTYPLSHPDNYISLRDGEDEIGIVKDLKEFDAGTQAILYELLERRYFVPRVRKILSTKQRYGGMTWQVETDRGVRSVITKNLHEALSENGPGRYFITDTDGNRFEVIMDEIAPEDAAWIESVV
ncbi:MAG: DUF1854 domain-containing protein [Armatimonadota bacterium]|nr:DUF1854 domain-containing protein [Armatimonadota bacterium]